MQEEIKKNTDPIQTQIAGIRSSKQGQMIIQCKNANGTNKKIIQNGVKQKNQMRNFRSAIKKIGLMGFKKSQ